jgi:hypothetical protein
MGVHYEFSIWSHCDPSSRINNCGNNLVPANITEIGIFTAKIDIVLSKE